MIKRLAVYIYAHAVIAISPSPCLLIAPAVIRVGDLEGPTLHTSGARAAVVTPE